MKYSFPRTVLVSLIVFSFLSATDLNAEAENTPCTEYTIENITEGMTGDSESPSISGDGTRIAFESTVDITEENPDGTYQIFIYDVDTKQYTQVTDDKKWGSVGPSINADGTKVAFVSGANVKGNNPEALNEIYIYDTDTGEFTQVTQEGQSFNPSINADGSLVAFTSNMDSNVEVSNIYIYESLSGTSARITDETNGGSTHPKISASGEYVTFQSNSNIGGANPENKFDIYIISNISGTAVPVTLSVNGVGSISPSINSDGRFVAFQSDENKDGENPHGNFNIYFHDSVEGKLTQITNEPEAGNAGASINADGTLIAFQSSGNFSGKNPEGNVEIFVYNTSGDVFIQITDGKTQTNTGAEISADGSLIVFVSEANSDGENSEGNNDIYLASCADKNLSGVSPDLLNKIILVAAVVIGLALLLAFRRKKASSI